MGPSGKPRNKRRGSCIGIKAERKRQGNESACHNFTSGWDHFCKSKTTCSWKWLDRKRQDFAFEHFRLSHDQSAFREMPVACQSIASRVERAPSCARQATSLSRRRASLEVECEMRETQRHWSSMADCFEKDCRGITSCFKQRWLVNDIRKSTDFFDTEYRSKKGTNEVNWPGLSADLSGFEVQAQHARWRHVLT